MDCAHRVRSVRKSTALLFFLPRPPSFLLDTLFTPPSFFLFRLLMMMFSDSRETLFVFHGDDFMLWVEDPLIGVGKKLASFLEASLELVN
ncbi:unnamed protein product [Brassica rapa subsp. narinosa]